MSEETNLNSSADESVLARLEKLESQLQLAEDRVDIIETLYRLAHTIDYGEHASWIDCFTEDAEFSMVEMMTREPVVKAQHVGRDKLASFIPNHTSAPDYFHKHLVANPVVKITGDTAYTESYMTRVDEGDRPFVWSIGRYRDDWVRGDDGRWRVRKRIIEVECRAIPVKASDIGGNE